MDLTEAENTKKRWQEYTERYQKKNKTKQNKKQSLNDPYNHDDVITYLEQESWSAKSSGP